MYAYFYDNKFVYIVYEKANGGNLFELIKSGHHFSNEELAKIFAEITRGLIYLKKRNIIHRDLKLENILVHQEEDQLTHQIEYHIKITDFGCSCQYFNKKPTTICGTAEYLAPEICNFKPYDFAIDTWALGVIMYELISGHSPFTSGDNKITMEKIKAYNDFSSLSGHLVEKKVDKSFIEMMRKILEKDLSKRIQIEDVLTEKWMRNNLQENK